jgi:hypothetical protein
MEPIISNLVDGYERGRLSRRELVQSLAMLVVAAPAAAEESPPDAGLTATGIDHVSVLARDLKRSVDFYQSLFGLAVLSEDKGHGIVRLGRKRVIVSVRKEMPYGTVDHFGVGVEGFSKEVVTQKLRARGLQPQENWQYGYFVKDPDGVNVQLL